MGNKNLEVVPLGSKRNWMIFFACIATIVGLTGWASFNWWIGLVVGLGLLVGFLVMVQRKFSRALGGKG